MLLPAQQIAALHRLCMRAIAWVCDLALCGMILILFLAQRNANHVTKEELEWEREKRLREGRERDQKTSEYRRLRREERKREAEHLKREIAKIARRRAARLREFFGDDE